MGTSAGKNSASEHLCKAQKRRMVLLMPTTTYRADDFLEAAEALDIEVVYGTDRCHVLAEMGAAVMRGDSIVLDFKDPQSSADKIAAYAKDKPIGAIVGVDDPTAVTAALAQAKLGLPHNDPEGARATRDKLRMRLALERAGIRQARFIRASLGRDPERVAELVGARIGFPCVLKPRRLSASRGVIRADEPRSFVAAYTRVSKILAQPEVRARSIVVESFVPGAEVAVEGLIERGRLRVLAVFDKPDPLDGPFFEETIYVTPSRLAPDVEREIVWTTEAAARALHLSEGPVHAELRVNGEGVFVIEVAARSIGGLCARTLRFGLGISLESLILHHAFGLEISERMGTREGRASGVMMLPIARTGVLKRVGGIEAARAVPGIEDVAITAKVGREIAALPEGNTYLGFMFARAAMPEEVERALREAYARLEIEIAAQLPIIR
jgi:biotin carboxylase